MLIETEKAFKEHVAPKKQKWYLALNSPIVFHPEGSHKRYLELYFPFLHLDSNDKVKKVFAVRVSTMISMGVFTPAEKCWVVSTIASRAGFYHADKALAHLVSSFVMPKKLKRYYTRIGADRSKMTKEEIMLLAKNPKCVAGPLYGKRRFNHVTANAKDYKNQEFFEDLVFTYPEVNQDTNDCLVLAVNFALRHPLFTHRQQLIRLMQKRQHISET